MTRALVTSSEDHITAVTKDGNKVANSQYRSAVAPGQSWMLLNAVGAQSLRVPPWRRFLDIQHSHDPTLPRSGTDCDPLETLKAFANSSPGLRFGNPGKRIEKQLNQFMNRQQSGKRSVPERGSAGSTVDI